MQNNGTCLNLVLEFKQMSKKLSVEGKLLSV